MTPPLQFTASSGARQGATTVNVVVMRHPHCRFRTRSAVLVRLVVSLSYNNSVTPPAASSKGAAVPTPLLVLTGILVPRQLYAQDLATVLETAVFYQMEPPLMSIHVIAVVHLVMMLLVEMFRAISAANLAMTSERVLTPRLLTFGAIPAME